MSIVRHISMILLISSVLLHSTATTVFALVDSEIAINSIDDLTLQTEVNKNITRDEQIVIENKSVTIDQDIATLIAAQEEYRKIELAGVIVPIFGLIPLQQNVDSVIADTHDRTSPFYDFLKPVSKPFITGERNKKIRLKSPAKKARNVSGTRGDITVQLITGTIISSATGDTIDPNNIDIASVSEDVKIKAKTYNLKKKKTVKKGGKAAFQDTTVAEVFEFGIPGSHLIFSSPVSISIATPLYSDGIAVDIAVLHTGDSDFNTSGLSTAPDTLCNTDGTASKPGGVGIVANGRVTFYTCGASSFTFNPTGGIAGSNDIKLIVGDCAQAQIYYNNLTQVYGGNPPSAGCGSPSAWPILRIGSTNYGNSQTAWTSATTTGSTNGNVYTATTTMTALTGGLTYSLIIDWSHTAPHKYLTWSYRVIVPMGNTQNIKFYYGMDSYVAGADASDVGYYTTTGGQTVGIYDNVAKIISAFRYISGPIWSGYQANGYNLISGQISSGADFNKIIDSTGGDMGFGINWNFGTTANITYSGTVEWRLLPYVSSNVVDLIPGIGQPEGPLVKGYLSQVPIVITNAGNLTSSGVHTTVLTLPANIAGPVNSFVDNAWSCGATVGVSVTCTKTTTIDSLATDTFRIPVIPLPSAAANVTFTGSIANSGDSNNTNNTATAINSVATSTLVNSPGGVSGMTLWLKGNGTKNCAVDGCTINAWSNSGSLGAAADAVTGLGTVTYSTSTSINNNPTLYFNNASLNTNSNLSITTAAASTFTMTKLATGGIFRIGPQSAIDGAMDWSTQPTLDRLSLYNGTLMYNASNGRGSATSDITSTARATGGTATNWTNGFQTVTTSIVGSPYTSTNLAIGRTNTSNSVLANVGEVIIYPTEIIGTSRNKVESYLAIKYGTTLDQTVAQNYTLSNNAIAWHSTTAGIFKKDIAGIARDDVSALSQTKSQTINTNGDIIVNSVASIASNYQSLIWANNGDAITSLTAMDTPIGYQRLKRIWQFQEKNGDIGTLKIAYPATSFPSGSSSVIYMLTDSDGIFSAGASILTGTLNAGNWEFMVNIADMQFITFAQASSDTVNPVIVSISRASGSLMPIGNFPIIVGYSDTDSMINVASFTGEIYSWNATNGNWNTTNLASSYMTIVGTSNTTTGSISIVNLPFGKYRFDFNIADNAGNKTIQSITYFVDAIEWSASSDQYDIGTVMADTQIFGAGMMIITVKTVGAPFTVTMNATNTLTKGSDTVNFWNGVAGWGYDSGGSILASIGTSVTVATQGRNINQNGIKNTYTYPIKYGAKISTEMIAGFYAGSVGMDMVATY